MIDPLETEIKLAASPAMLEQLRAHPALGGTDKTASTVTTYFDTIDGRLRLGGASLRIRDDDKGLQQTFKLASPAQSVVRRGEWNAPAEGDLPDVSAFPARPRSTLLRLLDGAELKALATTRVERTTRRLRLGKATIEVVFDQGTIQAGEREDAICELELELLSGQLADILVLVLKLPLGSELRWSVATKAGRCHALALDRPPAAVLAAPMILSPAMDVAEGFRAIGWNCLEQLLTNYPLVIASADPEAIHQSRVAIRRLRAAMGLFRDILDDDEAPVLRSEFRAAAGRLGPARDLDVLLDSIALEAKTEDQDVAELLAHLRKRRDAAANSAQTMLAEEQFQRLLFQFTLWLEQGKWLTRKSETGGNCPLKPLVERILARRRRRLRRACSDLNKMADAALHRLRIDVKKLRYATDFFESLYPGVDDRKLYRKFAKSLAKLQDSLGSINDMAVSALGRTALFTELDPITAARLEAELEGLSEASGQSRARLLKTAEGSLSRLKEAQAWWKSGYDSA